MKILSALLLLTFIIGSCIKDPVSPNNNNGVPVTYPSPSASMYTNFSNDWDNWRIKIGDSTISVFTAFSEDWDNWDFSVPGLTGDIRTSFSEDWDNWNLTTSDVTIKMRTSFSNDWDNWDLDDYENGWHADVRTSYSDDWDNWDVYDDGIHLFDLQTNFSDDFDNWRCYGEFPAGYTTEQRIAVLFIPIFISALHQQGIVE